MLLFGLENHISITDRIGVSLTLNYRTSFNEKQEFTRVVKFDSGDMTSTSEILNVMNVALQFGYLF